MAWQETPYTLILVVAAAISMASALYVWLRYRGPGTRIGMVVSLADVVWILGYALELGIVDQSAKVFLNKMQYLGIVVVPGAWLAFTLLYTGRGGWLTSRHLALLCVEPVGTLALVFTNESHNLFWGPASLVTDGPFSVLVRPHGVAYWIHAAYTYTLLLIALFLLIQMLVLSRHLYRWQASVLLLATSLPLLSSVLMVSGLGILPHLDLTPLAFTGSSLMLTWSLFYLRGGDIVPVARRAIVENMSDGVIVLDQQNHVVDLNAVVQSIFGHTASEVIGQPVEQIWTEYPDLIKQHWDGSEINEEVALGEGDVQRTYDVRISPIFDWRNRLTSRVVVLRDNTERKRSREVLSQYAERLRILHAIDGAILAARSPEEIGLAALHHMLQLVSCQRASVALFDFGVNDVTLLSVHADSENELQEKMQFSVGEMEELEVLQQYEVLVVRDNLDRSALPSVIQALEAEGVLSYIHTPLIFQSELIGCLSLGAESRDAFVPQHTDIAREVADHLAVALHQARVRSSLEELDRQKTEFISVASHELRSPLTSARTFIQNLLDGVYGELSDDQSSRLKIALERINDEILLVNSLLDLSRLEAQSQPLVRAPEKIADLIYDVLQEFKPRAERKEIALTIGSLQGENVLVDQGQIRRVLANLLSNALKFTPAGGRITLSSQSQDEFVEVQVADTGIGIPEDQLEQVFDKFYQLDSSTTREFSGIGLGLAIAKQIVELHGGAIWVESQPGVGSVFHFTLPKAPA